MKKTIYHTLWLLALVFLMSACGGGSTGSNETENQAPLVSAGENQTVSTGDTVVLQAEASDSDGSITTLLWQQTAGTSVQLTSSDSLATSFIAPDISISETLTFSIFVTDNNNATRSDSVDVLVEPRATTCQLDNSQIANCTLE